MELPSNLRDDRVPAETAVVCATSIEDWCARYVDSDQCRRDWRDLHRAAMSKLAADDLSGSGHGFALADAFDAYG